MLCHQTIHFDNEKVKQICFDVFGLVIEREIRQLDSYEDWNFHVRGSYADDIYSHTDDNCVKHGLTNHGFVLKIMSPLNSKNVSYIEGQHAMMLHLLRAGIPTQKPLASTTGSLYQQIMMKGDGDNADQTCIVRLFEFIPGVTLMDTPFTPASLYNVGRFCARVLLSLKDFQHPAYETCGTHWNLQNMPEIRKYLPHVKNDDDKALISDVIRWFEEKIQPSYGEFQRGIIHSDMNPGNLLMTSSDDNAYDVAALLDFCDSNKSFWIFECAPLLCYIIVESQTMDHLAAARSTLGGFLSLVKLNKTERKYLRTLICSSMAMYCVFGEHKMSLNPQSDIFVNSLKSARKCLQELWKMSDEDFITNTMEQQDIT